MNVCRKDNLDLKPSEVRRRVPRIVWIGAFGAWMAATIGALAAMHDYASRPGAAARAPATWPDASRLPRPRTGTTLVMVAHTKCACTRASLHELERIMTHASEPMVAFVVFVGPHEERGAGGLLDVRDTARAIPNVTVVEDDSEARLFGAATSGQVLLYDQAGALVFRGGITPARGHEGTSVGSEAVRRLLTTQEGPPEPRVASSAPASDVFGCALFDQRSP